MSNRPMSGTLTYSSSKIYASYFGHGLGPELDGKIDVMAYEPGGVATKMINNTDGSTDCVTILPKMAADTCFRDLGFEQLTRGAFRHEFLAWMLDQFPLKMIQIGSAKGNADYLKKVRAEEAEKEKNNNA